MSNAYELAQLYAAQSGILKGCVNSLLDVVDMEDCEIKRKIIESVKRALKEIDDE